MGLHENNEIVNASIPKKRSWIIDQRKTRKYRIIKNACIIIECINKNNNMEKVGLSGAAARTGILRNKKQSITKKRVRRGS